MASNASAARAIASRLLQEADAGAEKLNVKLPHRFLTALVGDHVRFGSEPRWVITAREVRGLSVELEMRRLAPATGSEHVPSDPGRILESPALVPPPSIAVAVEPPVPISGGMGAGAMLLIASGTAGWRGADLSVLQGGEEIAIGTSTQLLPFGVLTDAIAGGPATIWDEKTVLSVDVSAGSGLFLARSNRDVLDGAGLLALGGELIQYREARSVEPGIVRLTGLLRGRFGTPIGEAAAGTLVMAVPRTSIVSMQVDPDAIGRDLTFVVAGAGDASGGAVLSHRLAGCGWAPFSPVHLRTERLPDGTVICGWVERHRANWRWETAQIDVLGAYVVHVRNALGVTRTVAAEGTGARLAPSWQTDMFGTLLSAAEVRVEAVGEGPETVRFTPWVSI